MASPDQETASGASEFGPWNPGIVSHLPRAFLPLATVYREDNVESRLGETLELSDFSGLPPQQLALFRAERLVVHEVLIRVMADLSVPVGKVYADLGVNFRRIVATILEQGIDSRLGEIREHLRAIRAQADAVLDRELSAILDDPPPVSEPETKRGWDWKKLLGGRRAPTARAAAPVPADLPTRAIRHLDDWKRRTGEADDALALAACEALRSVVSGIVGRQNALVRDKALLRSLAGILVSNRYGSRRIGELIEPWIAEVVDRNGYRRVGPQERPVVMNVKGSSASGKSTIRPYQRALVSRIGADWSDFAVITPDVWRKFLLDYGSLGDARRYAGTLTGHEVEIVDAKLDSYMARKAAEGRISHLLIDRFRFDSFTADPGTESGSQLLTRFGHSVYMQFMVTPPQATVERAWKRGEQFGRYKAVEDLLAHNVEAYTGMPRLFFTWALRRDKEVFFEFLDNSVPEGERPRTIAFGTNGAMTILDAKGLLDIDRFRKIDIYARSPEEVFRAVDLSPEKNTAFLRDCVRRVGTVRFAEHGTGRAFARLDRGRVTGLDRAVADRLRGDPEWDAALAVAGIAGGGTDATPVEDAVQRPNAATLGRWGAQA